MSRHDAEREMREWAEMYAARPLDGTAIDGNNHQWARDVLVVFGWLDAARRGPKRRTIGGTRGTRPPPAPPSDRG